MSALALRILAMLLMLIDHVGVLFTLPLPLTVLLRALGRISFPIFAFLIANGMQHTKNRLRYVLCLLGFALISEPFFDFALRHTLWHPDHQNVFFTLFLGALGIFVLDHCKKRTPLWHILGISIVAILLLCARVLHTDYDAFGVALILFLSIFWQKKAATAVTILLFSSRELGLHLYAALILGASDLTPQRWDLITLCAAISILPILFYNGKKGYTPKNQTAALLFKYGFYLFYPLHLLLLITVAAIF